MAEAPCPGRFWFAITDISNGLFAMTLRHIEITPRIVIGAVLTVGGVALVLAS